MKMKIVGCGRESELQETRPWWEPPYVIYGFSNPRVKSRIEHLMGNYVVRATDVEYMRKLQLRIREDHLEQMERKILERELGEVEREKRLILEGKMPMEEAPAELANHPVFKVTLLVEKILRERRLKEQQKKRPKKVKKFDYDLLQGIEEEVVEDTDLIECIEGEEDMQDVRRRLDELEESMEEQDVFTDDDYLRIKYMDPLIEELMEVETVDDIYEIGQEVVGALSGKPCGGLKTAMVKESKKAI